MATYQGRPRGPVISTSVPYSNFFVNPQCWYYSHRTFVRRLPVRLASSPAWRLTFPKRRVRGFLLLYPAPLVVEVV